MLDATARIKNLSIALAEVSRAITSIRNFQRISRIEDLLDDAIKEEETKLPSPARPATTTSDDEVDSFHS